MGALLVRLTNTSQLFHAVFLIETVHTTSSIENFLLAGIEGVAL